MYDAATLKKLKDMDIRNINRSNLANYTQLLKNEGITAEERIKNYMEMAGANPYFYEDNGFIVKSVLSTDNKLSFIDCTKQLVSKRAGMAF